MRSFRLHLLAIAMATVAQAQAATSQIQGTVLDSDGKAIANAKVHVHGRQQFVVTDKQGNFRLNAPANAQIHVAARGFSDAVVTADSNALQVKLVPSGIERIMISAAGLHHYDVDSAHPATVLAGDELLLRNEPTIGETLKLEPGVHSNYYGPVASSPVIRGMDGPRVKMLSNSMDTGDVSRIGPDHSITADALTTEQIEVLRGPATLLFGSGAIGGLVNIVDNRLPRQLRPLQTKLDLKYGSVADERSVAFAHDGSSDAIAWHIDGLDRQSNDVKTPTFTDADGEVLDSIVNSGMDTQNINVGTSYIGERGLIGVTVGKVFNYYGIPGHDHGDEDHAADDHADDHAGEEEHVEGVFADAKQTRYGLVGELYSPFSHVESLAFNLAYTDYTHVEIEDGAMGTRFSNKTLESRWTLEHSDIAGWHGLVGVHQQSAKFKAAGEEAFTPATNNDTYALFVLEERDMGPLQWQLGARAEHVGYDVVEQVPTSSLALPDLSFTATSASAGVVWNFVENYQWSLQLSHSSRAPSAAETYANGVHVATGSYELGSAYQLSADGDLSLAGKPANEVANNIDVGFKRVKGDVTFGYNFFYNKISDFLYESDTGLTAVDLLPDTEAPHDEFKVYQFVQRDVTLKGAEFNLTWQFAPGQQLEVFADTVHATLDDGGYLPRIPPLKAGTEYRLQRDLWNFSVGATHYAKQSKTASEETPTDGYTMLDASVSYDLDLDDQDANLYLRLSNLSNQLGKVHSSFIKESTPLPGRSLVMGITARF